jgi:NAD(P)-dependent dehydrogenase (short-subunit alcohol dehydrogenase family)
MVQFMQSLDGKSVLVTGASSGIGKASAIAFARAGMRVAVSARSADRLAALAVELGPQTIILPADLTIAAEVDALVDTAAERLGGLDVLFANAGVYIAGDVADGNPDDWDKLLALNVNAVSAQCIGPFHICGAVAAATSSSPARYRHIRRSPSSRSTVPPSTPSMPSCTGCGGS